MIVFMDNPEHADMLRYKFPGREPVILNLSSFYSGHISITHLITKISPINNTGLLMPDFVNSVEFDMQYASAVLNTPELFGSLINIMLRAYEGFIVCILVQRDPYRDAVMESLIKLIQQRYSYNCWIIEDIDDIEVISEKMLFPNGLLTLDEDIKQYNQMYSKGLVGNILPNINIE
jgi:hypothetical protein